MAPRGAIELFTSSLSIPAAIAPHSRKIRDGYGLCRS